MSSAVLVQVKGWQRSLWASMNARMAVTSCLTLSKEPRRIAWRVMIPKNTSTRFSHEPEVGVKCSVIRGCLASHRVMSLVGVVVVEHDVQLAARVSAGDKFEEVQELGLAVAVVAAVGDLAG